MKTFLLFLATCLMCLMVACSMLQPQQRDRVRETILTEHAAGNITTAQRDAAIEALDSDEPFDWASLGLVGANIALALIGGPMIVRMQRGRPTQKVGLPASKVRQA